MRGYFRSHRRIPLAVAGFISFPLFLESLLASSLRLDEPTVSKAIVGGKPTLVYGQTAPATEAKIWAAALVPALVLIGVGVLAMMWRRVGVYIVCLTGAGLAYLVSLPLERWAKGHTARFPGGFDLVPDNDPSNLLQRGEWEHNARVAAVTLSHWTIAIAAGIAVVAAVLELRRRRGIVSPPVPPPPHVATGDADISPHTQTGPP